jgi:hypothetical protein
MENKQLFKTVIRMYWPNKISNDIIGYTKNEIDFYKVNEQLRKIGGINNNWDLI